MRYFQALLSTLGEPVREKRGTSHLDFSSTLAPHYIVLELGLGLGLRQRRGLGIGLGLVLPRVREGSSQVWQIQHPAISLEESIRCRISAV